MLSIEQVLRMLLPRPSALQLAICHAADGAPVTLAPNLTQLHFGCDRLPRERPVVVEMVAGVRGGKSTIAIAAAVSAALSVDLSGVRPHELPRVAIVGPTVDAASATFRMLCEAVRSTELRPLLAYESESAIMLRRPNDQRQIEIVVVAAHRGGLSVRNRWLAGLVLEEVAHFAAEAVGAVVNAEEILRAARTRLLPGAQAWLASSPYGPEGLLYATWKRHFGKPGRTLVVHAPTRSLNPDFPQSQIDALAEEDPDAALREYGAQWVDADSAWLPAAIVDPAIRDEPLVRPAPPPGVRCFAAIDPATRGNAWTLSVAWGERGAKGQAQRVIVAASWEWKGSKSAPLSPRDVLGEIAALLKPYRVTAVYSDPWAFDAMRDHAQSAGLELRERGTDSQATYQRLRALLASGAVELPPVPQLRSDLLAVRRRATAGAVRIELPKTADGRHCDHVPAVATAVERAASGATRAREHAAYNAMMQRHRGGGTASADAYAALGAPTGQREIIGGIELIVHERGVSHRRRKGKPDWSPRDERDPAGLTMASALARSIF